MKISLEQPQAAYRPGASIRGRVAWANTDAPIESLDVRLIWYTQGKGTRDVAVVDQQTIAARTAQTSVDFQFTAPRGPHSFSGKLVSLVWAIEVIALPSREAERAEIVIAPQGKEILLSSLDQVPLETSPESA